MLLVAAGLCFGLQNKVGFIRGRSDYLDRYDLVQPSLVAQLEFNLAVIHLLLSETVGRSWLASSETPKNSDPRMSPMATRVVTRREPPVPRLLEASEGARA